MGRHGSITIEAMMALLLLTPVVLIGVDGARYQVAVTRTQNAAVATANYVASYDEIQCLASDSAGALSPKGITDLQKLTKGAFDVAILTFHPTRTKMPNMTLQISVYDETGKRQWENSITGGLGVFPTLPDSGATIDPKRNLEGTIEVRMATAFEFLSPLSPLAKAMKGAALKQVVAKSVYRSPIDGSVVGLC